MRASGLPARFRSIKAFGAAALVTPMPDTELQSLFVSPDQLRRKASELGLEWYQLPAPHAGIPGKGFFRSSARVLLSSLTL
jgi:hypothetical protein